MRVITGILAVLALLASGCTEAPEPGSLPKTTPVVEASPTAVPLPTTTSQPLTAAESTDSAVEAMESFFNAANAASTGVGIESFRALFSEGCQLCMLQYSNFSSAYAIGQSAEGTLYQTWDIEVQDSSSDRALVLTTVDTGSISLTDADGVLIDSFPAEEGVATVWTLKRQPDESWLIINAADLP
jgi:hypothetical protein